MNEPAKDIGLAIIGGGRVGLFRAIISAIADKDALESGKSTGSPRSAERSAAV